MLTALLIPLLLTIWVPLAAQSASKPRPTSPAPPAQAASDAEADALQRAIDAGGGEPGAQTRALEAFLRQYPHSSAAAQVYEVLVKDANALEDDQRALLYNEKLQQLHPEDLRQRITTLNLLLLNDDPASIAKALDYARQLRSLVEAKAHEKPPEELGHARWLVDINRLRSLSELLQGSAYAKAHRYGEAEGVLQASLRDEASEEAAEELGKAYQAEGKVSPALDAYAEALALPGSTIAERSVLRTRAGELYRRLHNGSEAGFGDLVMRHFDEIATADQRERNALNENATANKTARQLGAFTLVGLDGRQHRLDDLHGKVAVVDFWATWCGPCLALHPILEDLKKKYGASGKVAFVAVNADEDRERVRPFLAEHHWAPDTWLDSGLQNYLGIDSLPTILVFSPSGQMVFRQSGFDEESFEAQLDDAIQQALNARS